MGCGNSSIVPYEPINIIEKGHHALLLDIGFTRHSIDQLYSKFLEVDVDNTNSLSAQEWFIFFEIEPSALILNFLKILDMDNSGELSFTEFIFSVWNFLTLDSRSLGGFVFLMCTSSLIYRSATKKMENAIDIDDFIEKLTSLHTKSTEEGKRAVQQAIARGRKRWKQTHLYSDQAEVFCYENQSLVVPLVKLRDKFRDKLIGRPFWEDMTNFRNDDDDLNKYDYIFVVRDELIRIDIESTKLEEKEARKREIAAKKAGKGMRPDKRSFIQKHFGMHRSQHNHSLEKAQGSNKSLRHEGTTDWDIKAEKSKKNKFAAMKRLDGVREGGLKPSAVALNGDVKNEKQKQKQKQKQKKSG